MSSNARDKHGGMGSPANRSNPAPVANQSKKKELRADFLLNFSRPAASQQRQTPNSSQRHRGSQGYGYQGGGRRYHAPASFAKGRFVQSSFRLFVDSVTQDVVEAAFSADSLLGWQSVSRVDLLCEEHPKCPICLEEMMVVPKITRCGHIYCAPCVMRYYMTLQENNIHGRPLRCPVCNEPFTPDDLTSVRLQMVTPLAEGGALDFVLAHRSRNQTSVWLAQPSKADGDTGGDDDEADDGEAEAAGLRLPRERDRGWHLGRLLRLAPGEADRLLSEEVEALRNYRPAAIAAGDTELLPSIDAAVSLLKRRQQERGSAVSSRDGAAASASAAPAPSWECRYVDIPGDLVAACYSVSSARNASGKGSSRRSGASASSSAARGGTEPSVASLTVNFKGGEKIGINGLEEDTGHISDVDVDKQAYRLGVRNGMYMLTVNGLPFTRDLLTDVRDTKLDWKATFAQVASPSGGGPQCVASLEEDEDEFSNLPAAAVSVEEDADDEAGVSRDAVDADATASSEQDGKVAPANRASPAMISQAEGGGGGIISHYQLSDGRLVFLQPFATRLLLHEYGGRWDNLPEGLVGLRLDRLQEQTVTDDLRKRHKFLSHLPVGSQISFADVDLRNHLSRETKEHFAEDFAKLREQRKKDQQKAKKEERISASRAQEEEEKWRSLRGMHPLIVQNVPTKDDFAVDLHGRELQNVTTDDAPGEAPATADAEGGDVPAADLEAAPTLADKIKAQVAGKAKPKKAGQRAAAAGYKCNDADSSFPTLGGGKGSAAPAWGRGRGGRGTAAGGRGAAAQAIEPAAPAAPAAAPAAPAAAAAPVMVPDAWDDDDAAQEDPSLGEALDAVIRQTTSTSEAHAETTGGAIADGADSSAVADARPEEPASSGSAATSAESGKKKKGKAKATTIRLFG